MNGATKRRWQQSCSKRKVRHPNSRQISEKQRSVAVEKWTSKGGAICSSRSTVADEAEKDSGSEDRKTSCSIETAGGHGQSANSICSLRRYVSSRRTSEERDTLELAEEPATQRNGSLDTSEPFSVRNEPHIQTSSKNNQCVTVLGKREAPDDLKLDNSSATGTLENVDNAETSRRSKDKRCANVDAPVAIVSDKSVSGGQCFSRGTRRSASVTANFTPVAHVSKKRLEDGLCQEAHDNGSSTSRSSKNPDLDSFCRRQETLSECGRQRTRQAISESGEDNRKGLHRARSMCTASLERHRRSRLGIDSKHERKQRAGRACPHESIRVAGRGNRDDVSLFLFVDHESAHQSIRNSAQGAIGALAAALESIQTRIPPDSKDEIIRQEVNPASELLVGSSAALGIEYEKPRTQAQSGHMTVQQEQRSNDENSGDVTGGRSEDLSQDNCHCSDLDVEDFLENQRYNEQQSKIKDEKHTPSSTPPAEATMETVYRLLAVVDAHRTRNINHQSQGSLVPNPPCDLAWKIEMGNDDLVDAVNQTISIKQKDGEECHDNIIIIPERDPEIWTDCVPPTLSNQSQRAYQWDAMCRPASLITGTETDSSVAVSLGPSKNCQSSCRPPSAETELMRDYYRHFPTLGDLLTEPDRSKHCDIFKEILVSNGKCCADIQTAATLSPSIKGDENTAKSQLGDILHSRYFKVEKSRPEVYRIVSSAFQKVGGWKTLPETPHWEYAWNLLWTWHRPRIDYNRLLSFQKVNHFPESRQLTRKDNLKRCIERFQKAAGRRAEHFRIIPKTFLLPKEYTAMVSEMCEMSDCPTKQKRVWICKPKDSSRGRGIFLTNSVEDIRYTDNLVVQEYIANPLLLNGRKFDLRLYVLVTSFNPLEAFVYKQGFARVARVPFTLDPEHLDNRFMHLTNAAIQSEWQEVSSDSDNDAAPPRSPASALSPWRHRTSKQRKSVLDSSPRGRGVPRSEGFVGASFTFLGVDSHGAEAEAEKRKYTKRSRPQEQEDEGISKGNHEAKNEFSSEDSKILLDELRQRLEQNGVDWDAVWQKVLFVILKSLSCCGDSIPHHPNAFELFGYDVLIDTDLRPWLIEVNSSPSMGQEHEADRKVKPGLIEDTLRLVNPISYDRLKLSEQTCAVVAACIAGR
ncbi:Tubulin-tyrosine ligase family protein [Toxoplasma gondii MAS]|uniref:Tubulin-tyrosine ligase family protein n=1 Tax=Toxoplasma gondii MAS TaxID=943118 RepID=A0A086QBQ5_TOXGO|nr:Tubulin-tyrosine ligase family protein [Toxoplasma gondii MAS]